MSALTIALLSRSLNVFSHLALPFVPIVHVQFAGYGGETVGKRTTFALTAPHGPVAKLVAASEAEDRTFGVETTANRSRTEFHITSAEENQTSGAGQIRRKSL
jgi:hypothetical protein